MSKVLVFSDGTKVAVTEDSGKFWKTEKAQFRKSNPRIVDVIEEKEDKKPEQETAPVKKKSKKAKAEE